MVFASGDIGGSLALLVGASAITVFEIIDIFLHHAAKRRARNRRKAKEEKEKQRLINPQPVAVPMKRSRHHPEMPFDDDPFYHPPFHGNTQHQYAGPEYSEIQRPRQKRPHSRHDQPHHDRSRPSSHRRPRSKNYDDPSGYHLHPEQHAPRHRSRSKSPRAHYRQ